MKKRTSLLLASIGIVFLLGGVWVSKKMPLPSFPRLPGLTDAEKSPEVTPQSGPVDDEWFQDAAFIGHSLIEGLEGYSGLEGPDFYAETGFSAVQSMHYKKFPLPNGGTGSLRDGLSQKSYGKVYIMFGINEISDGAEAFTDHLTALLDLVQEYQPDAKIYMMALTPTTQNQSNGPAFHRDHIIDYNVALQKLCDARECTYVDLFSCFADEMGYLPEEKSADGIHLQAEQYVVMLDYLKHHT